MMKATYLKDESWEKQKVYRLPNGIKARIEHNQFYGEFIAALIQDDEIKWHCSNGVKSLPKELEFAKIFEERVYSINHPNDDTWLVPKFEKIYANT